ncbi:MAG: glycogen-binding domain-containing protein, partial [Phycisphaerae bacterium]|nr:glycogen-binding domain-containing protein [Phycisphaerae bacterium]
TVVNFNTKLKEAASLGQPICEYDPASRGHKDFQNLAQELIASDARVEQKQIINSLRKPELQPVAKEQTREEIIETFETNLDSISSSAQELMAGLNKAEKEKIAKDIDNKLNNFYGARQFGEAVKFVTLYPRAKSVQIAGDFNNWQPQQTDLKATQDGKWELALALAPGKYRYRMVVDGQWQQDPYNENAELNPFGEYNSVLEVK